MTRHLAGGASLYHTAHFRRCTAEDFAGNGYLDEPPVSLEKVLCPDTEGLGDWYRLKNSYSNVTERSSFSLEVITCNEQTFNGTCASDDDIEQFVEHLLITQYFVAETINYREPDNYKTRPTRVESIYYQQFGLKYDGYRDNNNLIRHNKAITDDFRF